MPAVREERPAGDEGNLLFQAFGKNFPRVEILPGSVTHAKSPPWGRVYCTPSGKKSVHCLEHDVSFRAIISADTLDMAVDVAGLQVFGNLVLSDRVALEIGPLFNEHVFIDLRAGRAIQPIR